MSKSQPEYRRFLTGVVVGGSSPQSYAEGSILRFEAGVPIPETLAAHTEPLTFEQAALAGVKVADFDAESYQKRSAIRPDPPKPVYLTEKLIQQELDMTDDEWQAVRPMFLPAHGKNMQGELLWEAEAVVKFREKVALLARTAHAPAPKRALWSR